MDRGRRRLTDLDGKAGCRKAHRKALQRASGGELGATSLVLEAAGTRRQAPPRRHSLGLQHLETGFVHWLKRLTVLEPLLRGGVECRRRRKRVLPIEIGSVALETECRGPRRASGAFQLLSTPRAQRLGWPALEFPARKANPLVINHFRDLSDLSR